MTRFDLPDNWHTLIAGYVLGNLTPAEQAQFEQLLQAHPELQQEIQAYEATLAQLPQALPAQTPAPDLEDRIVQQLPPAAAHHHRLSLASLSPRRDRRRWLRSWPLSWQLGSAIAAGCLLLLGIDNYQLRRSLSASQQQLTAMAQQIQQLQETQQRTEAVLASLRSAEKAVYSLQGRGTLADASGSVVTLAAENKAILIPHNLPMLPPEQVYRFWAATAASDDLIYCGQFNTQADNTVEWSLPENGCSVQATQVLITVDPVTASTDSGGELVMQSPPYSG